MFQLQKCSNTQHRLGIDDTVEEKNIICLIALGGFLCFFSHFYVFDAQAENSHIQHDMDNNSFCGLCLCFELKVDFGI